MVHLSLLWEGKRKFSLISMNCEEILYNFPNSLYFFQWKAEGKYILSLNANIQNNIQNLTENR